jgi:hypothetical protein
VLYALDKTTGATAFLGIGEAILFGGFGITLGERSGAKEAEALLKR